MPTSEVHGLLYAVRRRLWQGQFGEGLRWALWGSTGLMLLAVAVQLAARKVPVEALLMAIAALWISMLALAVTRRPSDAACALWADRHLGGASAFTTLLETGAATQAALNPQAVRWLESWATARVPDGLRRLAERREVARLSRPLFAMLVCAALTALVLSMPDLAPAQRQLTAASAPSGTGDRMAAQAEPATANGVDKLAAALRSAPMRQPPDASQVRREAGAPQAAAPGKDDGAAQAAAMSAGESAARTNPSAGTAADAAAAAATPRPGGTGNSAGESAGTGTGNAAGDSRDARGDKGVSPAPRGTIAAPGSRPTPWPGSAERQADIGRLGIYDGESSMLGAAAMPALVAVAAATPPAASESTRLSPAETSYVQAWMKANAQRR